MTPAGWILLGTSWGFLLALMAFCFWRVFGRRSEEAGGGEPPPRP
jgi:hypothetical protein